MKLLKEGIYQATTKKPNFINKNISNILKKSASKVDRFRSRILYHSSLSSNPQHMLICFDNRSLVPVAFHSFSESFLLIEGVAHYKFYDRKGNVSHDIRLSPASLGGIFYVFISPQIPHRFFALTKHVLASEICHSHFSPELTQFGKGKLFSKADKLTSAQMAKQLLLKNSNTKIKKKKKGYYSVESSSGVAELSSVEVLSILKKNTCPVCFYPRSKMIGVKNKKEKMAEQIWAVQPKKKLQLLIKNTMIHIINGEAKIKLDNKNIILGIKKNFALGPINKSKIIVENISDQPLLFHIKN